MSLIGQPACTVADLDRVAKLAAERSADRSPAAAIESQDRRQGRISRPRPDGGQSDVRTQCTTHELSHLIQRERAEHSALIQKVASERSTDVVRFDRDILRRLTWRRLAASLSAVVSIAIAVMATTVASELRITTPRVRAEARWLAARGMDRRTAPGGRDALGGNPARSGSGPPEREVSV